MFVEIMPRWKMDRKNLHAAPERLFLDDRGAQSERVYN